MVSRDDQIVDEAEAVTLVFRRRTSLFTAEGDVRKTLGVERVGPAQVTVTIGDASVDALHINGDLDARVVGVVPVPYEPAPSRL